MHTEIAFSIHFIVDFISHFKYLKSERECGRKEPEFIPFHFLARRRRRLYRLFAALYRVLPSLNENSTFNIKEEVYTHKYTHHLVPIRSHQCTVSTINFHIHFP